MQMRTNIGNIIIGFMASLLMTTAVMAQYVNTRAEQVQSLMTTKRDVVLVDVRTPDEYQVGHIPGAINIPADRVLAEQKLLPKDRSTQVIFYCRGAG